MYDVCGVVSLEAYDALQWGGGGGGGGVLPEVNYVSSVVTYYVCSYTMSHPPTSMISDAVKYTNLK